MGKGHTKALSNAHIPIKFTTKGGLCVARPKQYLQKTVVAGDTIEIYKTQSSRYGLSIPRMENIVKIGLSSFR